MRKTFWEWGEPSLRFPFQCILAPDCLVPVHCCNADDDVGALGNGDLVNLLSMQASDRGLQGQDRVLPRTVERSAPGDRETSGDVYSRLRNE